MTRALRKAYEVRRSAEQELIETLKREFPQHARVEWERAGHVQHGVVTRHSPYQPVLWARNWRTRNEVKIAAADILRAAEMVEDAKS